MRRAPRPCHGVCYLPSLPRRLLPRLCHGVCYPRLRHGTCCPVLATAFATSRLRHGTCCPVLATALATPVSDTALVAPAVLAVEGPGHRRGSTEVPSYTSVNPCVCVYARACVCAYMRVRVRVRACVRLGIRPVRQAGRERPPPPDCLRAEWGAGPGA